ncbi:unnamed protein product [Nezara viridula]|uniref:Uncharacterized protein n=1 Tax=Nezara viridula TaxID=85310 RepID=A0A9P0HSW8_NEZVI|nr:unnamed protein product [Nezara viridula]
MSPILHLLQIHIVRRLFWVEEEGFFLKEKLLLLLNSTLLGVSKATCSNDNQSSFCCAAPFHFRIDQAASATPLVRRSLRSYSHSSNIVLRISSSVILAIWRAHSTHLVVLILALEILN